MPEQNVRRQKAHVKDLQAFSGRNDMMTDVIIKWMKQSNIHFIIAPFEARDKSTQHL